MSRARRWIALLVGSLIGAAVLSNAAPAAARDVGLICDVYLLNPDGTLGDLVASDATGFVIVASAVAPAEAPEGVAMTVTVPSETAFLASSVPGFIVVSQRDFVRTFQVSGGEVVQGSVVQTPSGAATAETTSTTVALGFATEAAGGSPLTFPEARFDVVPESEGIDVTVSLVAFEVTLKLRGPDGAVFDIRALCTTVPNELARTVVVARPVPVAETKADCKKGGWRNVTNDQGQPFRNQGQCVSYVVAHRP